MAYTDRVTGGDVIGGVAYVELHDVDSPANVSRIAFVSIRGLLVPGESIVIGGLASNGRGQRSFLVRLVGPTVAIPGAFPNPTLLVALGAMAVGSNDDWDAQSSELAPATTRATAFPLDQGGRDAALLLTGNLHAGAHTV